LDSGAKKSVIDAELAQRIILQKCPVRPLKGMVKTADGQTQEVVGIYTLPISFNSVQRDMSF